MIAPLSFREHYIVISILNIDTPDIRKLYFWTYSTDKHPNTIDFLHRV